MTPNPGETLDEFVARYWAAQPPHDPNCPNCLVCNGQFDDIPYGIWDDYYGIQ